MQNQLSCICLAAYNLGDDSAYKTKKISAHEIINEKLIISKVLKYLTHRNVLQ
jgi:hypothetical protein